MADVDVRPSGGGSFAVRVAEGGTETRHDVTVFGDDLSDLAREGETPEDLVRRCFEFLLAREPKESILASFELRDIGRFFPEFEREIGRR